MASLFFTCPLPLLRVQSNYQKQFSKQSIVHLNDLRLQQWYIRAVSKKSASQVDAGDALDGEGAGKASKNSQKTLRRRRKKLSAETSEESPEVMTGSANREEKIAPEATVDNSKKVSRKGRKKVTPLPSPEAERNEKKATKRRTRKKVDTMKDQSVTENNLEPISTNVLDGKNEELQLIEDEGEDISFTYSWPPLVCCFGAAQHLFIPSGRPADRLIDHKIHDSMKNMFWSPTKYIRAPGGPSSSVAVALAKIGGRVEFMGKLGDDEYGQTMLYYLNENKVQTRSVKLDSSKSTAVSHMKITKRGSLRLSCVEPCAEDSFLSSEINIDVLKEAKMFYFNSSSLLDQNLRSTTMQAIKISKKLGGVIFFDLNLPLPLWKSSEETKTFIQEAWNIADIIEVTKQELEFLCGIKPLEKFDTKDNDKSKFIHHKLEVVMQLWHENLKVLFVTNGTSKIHYYTLKDNGWVHGMEDPPITPFTGDMSVSGDAIVAALMRMLTVQPHLATDKGYLEHMIKYAINCGVIDQWLHARVCGFPPKEGIDFSVRSITEREYRTVEEPAA